MRKHVGSSHSKIINKLIKMSEMGLEPTQISPYAPETYVSTIPPLRLDLTINYSIVKISSVFVADVVLANNPLEKRYSIVFLGRVPLRLNLTINYFIFLKNSSEINCEYLFFSLTETSNLCSPPLVCATETIPPTSPIGNFLTLASNFT